MIRRDLPTNSNQLKAWKFTRNDGTSATIYVRGEATHRGEQARAERKYLETYEWAMAPICKIEKL